VVLMTCQHLFGAAGGLEQEIAWGEMRKQYPTAKGLVKKTGQVAVEGTVLQIPGAKGLDDETSGLDLAIFQISKPVKVGVLKLATANAKVDEIVFLNSPYVGWTPAKVVNVKNDQLTYRYFSAKVQIPGTSGAPIVNMAGEVIALNLGGGEQAGVTIGIGNPCERIRELVAKAK
jgi:S1-C subfamily serine protease